jgi:cyclic pyranopterin phosphate synthase
MEIMKKNLSHIDEQASPRMVDVSGKDVTRRQATAVATVQFPEDAWNHLEASGFSSSKGPIMDVARVAGTMAVKRTSDLIPFCHPLPVDGCDFTMEPLSEQGAIQITCTVTTTGRTGVEMEALTGASTAALTIYDMTKSLGHGIVIETVRLLAKSGGKSDYSAQ